MIYPLPIFDQITKIFRGKKERIFYYYEYDVSNLKNILKKGMIKDDYEIKDELY